MPDDLRRHESDPSDVDVAIVFAKPQPTGEVGADDIPIQDRDLPAMLEQEDGENFGRCRLSGPAQPGEPDAHTLAMPRGIGFCQDLCDFWPCEPAWQRFAAVQVLIAHLGAGD